LTIIFKFVIINYTNGGVPDSITVVGYKVKVFLN
jgi:hypothetical protein